MYASVMGKAGEVLYKEVETPKADGKNVLMEVKAVSICGTDKHAFEEGSMNGQIWGHEYCGIVADPGCRDDLKVGDRICCFPVEACGECEFCKTGREQLCTSVFRGVGGLDGAAEYVLLGPDNVIKFPETMSFEEAALVEPTSVVYHALKRSGAGPGKTLLVSGIGSLTGLLGEIAHGYGVEKVVATDGSDERAEFLLKTGAIDAFVNCDKPGFYTKLMEEAGSPLGFDAYIDIKGGVRTANEHMVCLKNGGIGVIVAEVPGDRGAINLYDLTEDEKTLTGSYGFVRGEFEEVIEMIASGKTNIKRNIGRTFGLAQAQEAFDYSFDRATPPSKIVITVG